MTGVNTFTLNIHRGGFQLLKQNAAMPTIFLSKIILYHLPLTLFLASNIVV